MARHAFKKYSLYGSESRYPPIVGAMVGLSVLFWPPKILYIAETPSVEQQRHNGQGNRFSWEAGETSETMARRTGLQAIRRESSVDGGRHSRNGK